MKQEDIERKHNLFQQARELIAELAETEDEISTVLQILAESKEWTPYLARAREKRVAFEAYWRDFWDTPETCSRCGLVGTRRDVNPLIDVPNYGSYCSSCAVIVRAAYQRNCLYCGKPYIASAINKYAELCKQCWREDWVAEARRVAVQLKRAQDAGVAASLSLKAWFVTLDAFAWRCAFCGGPFEAMDHFVPIEHGGGTEWSNCLPICKRDNTRKKNRSPLDPAMLALFPAERIERIKAYFSSLTTHGSLIFWVVFKNWHASYVS